MIKANELRLGNYVLKSGKFKELKECGLIDVFNFPSYFDPIPLTVEILLNNCGAKELKAKRGVLREFIIKTVRIELSNSGNLYYKNSKLILQHLHQLQNLFFALKNTELEYNG